MDSPEAASVDGSTRTTMSTTKARRIIRLTPVDDVTVDVDALANARAQIAAHGPGLTFGQLAIGECFEWPPPLPRGSEPMVKTAADRYAWSRGQGTAESFYRVETWALPA
jgi:hypothetical protein